jgi:hypothetical protein
MFIIVISVLIALFGCALIYLGYNEIKEEKDFIKKAITTKGVIVKYLNATVSKAVDFDNLREYKSIIPIIEYETEKGKKFQKKLVGEFSIDFLKKKEIEVKYNPEDPHDVMINSFYQISKFQQYAKFFTGIGIIVFAIIVFVSFYE